MTDTIESLRGRLTLAQREITLLRSCVADEVRLRKAIQKELTEELAKAHAEILAAEVDMGKKRFSEVQDLRAENLILKINLANARRENAALKVRISAITDQ